MIDAVKDFGAQPNNPAFDNHSILQSAIDTAAATLQELFIPAGLFYYSQPRQPTQSSAHAHQL